MSRNPGTRGIGRTSATGGFLNSADYGVTLGKGVWSVTRHGVFLGDYLTLRQARRAMGCAE